MGRKSRKRGELARLIGCVLRVPQPRLEPFEAPGALRSEAASAVGSLLHGDPTPSPIAVGGSVGQPLDALQAQPALVI